MRDLSFSTTPILLGVVLYLLTGCSVLSPKKNETNTSVDKLSEQALSQKIMSITDQIANDSANPDLYYQKGYLLGELALKKSESAKRSQTYQSMHTALLEAKRLFDSSELPSGIQKVDDLLKVRWSNEHNQGVQIIQTDSALSESKYQKAVAHFKNATIILPDTTISYKMKAQTQYKNNDLVDAISTLETAQQQLNNLPAELLEQLAFLYLENEQDTQAVTIYEKAKSFSNDNLNLIHGLSNAYIKTGNHAKAVELLRILTENNPDNIIYRKTLGTELYFLASEKFKTISSGSTSVEQNEILLKIESLLTKAESHYQKAYSENPNDDELKKIFVSFYQNSASKYQQILPLVNDDLSKAVEKSINTYLEQSIPLYKGLLAQRPNDKDIRNGLYETYSYLGMKNEAAHIKEI